MSSSIPIFICERLILRPFASADAAQVQVLAGDPRVYETTLDVPHPYVDGLAERWIATHEADFQSGKAVSFAVALREDATLIGTISLGINRQHQRAEMGYWLGVPWWGRGYCTEAARRVVRYSFEELDLHKVTCSHFAGNPASGRVMVKAGMQMEGELRDAVWKEGRFHTLRVYGLLRDEWLRANAGAV